MQKDVKRMYKNLLMDSLRNTSKWYYETRESYSFSDLDDIKEYHYFSYKQDNVKISISRGINYVNIKIDDKSVDILSCFNFWFESELGKLFRQMKKSVKTKIKENEFNELVNVLPNTRFIKINKILLNIKNKNINL